MKKTKTIETYYCDYCGAECEHTEFVMPSSTEQKEITRGIIELKCNTKIKPVNKDICPKCQEKIAYMLPIVANTDINVDSVQIPISFGG